MARTRSARSELILMVIVFFFLILMYWLTSYVLPNIGYDVPRPEFVVEQVTGCILKDGQMVPADTFERSSRQYICGNLKTDTEPIGLTLLVFKDGNSGWITEYVTSKQLSSGEFSFEISPSLPSGRYRALLRYARNSLAQIYFWVDE